MQWPSSSSQPFPFSKHPRSMRRGLSISRPLKPHSVIPTTQVICQCQICLRLHLSSALTIEVSSTRTILTLHSFAPGSQRASPTPSPPPQPITQWLAPLVPHHWGPLFAQLPSQPIDATPVCKHTQNLLLRPVAWPGLPLCTRCLPSAPHCPKGHPSFTPPSAANCPLCSAM